MACKAESCGRRRERLVITLTGSWRFQRAILPFENNNNGGQGNTQVQEKVKRNEGKEIKAGMDNGVAVGWAYCFATDGT